MGYNISDLGGETTGAFDDWAATLDLSDPSATTVSGDFSVVPIFGGTPSEATDGYTFSALSDPTFGSLTFNTTDGTYTFTVDRDAVFSSGTDQVVSFTVTGQSGTSSDTDTVVITILICVARGTMIDTLDGPVPVEDLEKGDQVITVDRGPQTVRWIGSRKVTKADLLADPSMYPVCICKDALGEGRPNRDLHVTQNHRVYLEDWRAELLFGEPQVLAPAKSLLNDKSIFRDRSVTSVEYFHVLFDDHNVIFTNGAPTESLHPGLYLVSTLTEESREELIRLLPELQDPDTYGSTARYGLKPWEATLLQSSDSEVWN